MGLKYSTSLLFSFTTATIIKENYMSYDEQDCSRCSSYVPLFALSLSGLYTSQLRTLMKLGLVKHNPPVRKEWHKSCSTEWPTSTNFSPVVTHIFQRDTFCSSLYKNGFAVQPRKRQQCIRTMIIKLHLKAERNAFNTKERGTFTLGPGSYLLLIYKTWQIVDPKTSIYNIACILSTGALNVSIVQSRTL